MSIRSFFAGLIRGTAIAAATGIAAFGLLVMFHPLAPSAPPAPVAVGSPEADALHARIETLRTSLRQAEASLADSRPEALTVTPPDASLRPQYEAQIAAATERRDLATRHAGAIRDALKSGLDVAALAEIRDSAVIGQLLSQQSALEAQIAEQGARLKPTHPVMRALLAQRGALATQIRDEATGIAGALEAEARLDDAQIALLQGELPPAQAAPQPAPAENAALAARIATQRTELDGLMDAYFGVAPGAATTTPAIAAEADPLTPANIAVAAVATLAAIMFQLLLAARRRKVDDSRDVAAWRGDRDPEMEPAPEADTEAEPLRRAS